MDENSLLTIIREETHVTYNIPIQIQSDYTDASLENPKLQLLLTLLNMDTQIDLQQNTSLDENAAVSITTVNTRTLHDVFKCVSVHGDVYENPVLYGDEFYICSFNEDGPTLYLTGLVSHVNNFGLNRRIPMTFTTAPDRFCKFRIVDPDPHKMITLTGTPVKTSMRVCVVHSYSKMLLAIDVNDKVTTSDCIDYGSHCYTYFDSCQRISSVNFWKFITQTYTEVSGNDDESATN